MYSDPLAYFITFTTRGSWLHGDARGSVTKSGQFIASNEHWEQHEQQTLNTATLILTPALRWKLELIFRAHCKKYLWTLHELNVRSNHIHIVVTASDREPERVMSGLKAAATKALRKSGVIPETQKPWTEHGSTRYLFTQEEFDSACHYVRDCQ